MNKLLTTFVVTTTLFFTTAQAQAQNWLYVGNGNGFEYYVDVSREIANGSYWSAPALAIASDNSKLLGKFLIDCSDYTYRAQFANFTSDWSTIGAGSPMAHIAENVCY